MGTSEGLIATWSELATLDLELLTWNVGVWRMIVRVGTFELGPSGTFAYDNIVSLAASFRL